MKNKKIQICDITIHPGEEVNLALPMPDRHSCAPLFMPIRVIHGKTAGPTLLVFSTLKGNELNGIEIVNRLIKDTKPEEISGTIMAIPVINVYGLTHYPKKLPAGDDLADLFPGSQLGSYGERLADLFTNELLSKADYCIELSTGDLNHNILPQVYCNFDHQETRKLAQAFCSPVITDVALRGNTLRQTTEDMGVPLIIYEGGEAMRFDENAIQLGLNGIYNVMKKLKMLSGHPDVGVKPTFSKDENWIVAHGGGILHSDTTLGQVIKAGEKLGRITDPFGTDENRVITSPRDGIIVGINTTPLVHEGLPLFKVASFINDERAEIVIGEWDEQQEEGFLS